MPETRNDWASEAPLAVFEAVDRVMRWATRPHRLQVQKSSVCDDMLVTVRRPETPRETGGLDVLRLSPAEFRDLADVLSRIAAELP